MFRFRLQRVLDLKERREREAAVVLAEARGAAVAARQARETLEAVRSESLDRLTGAHSKGAPIGELRNMSYVVESLNRQIQEARSVSDAADETVRRLAGEFNAAVRDRRALDLLRERRQEEWRADQVLADQQDMDGIALTRFVRADSRTGGN